MKVFISYAHEDIQEVKKYVVQLQEETHIEVFWDKNISPGTRFLDILAKETSETAFLVVFVSKSACMSKFVSREVLMVDSQQGIQTIPVYLEPIDEDLRSSGLMLLLTGIQGILANELGFDRSYQALTEAIRQSQMSEKHFPIVAIMGTKGGPGKSTIIAAMAELIASTGRSVAIIDMDIESAGITKYFGPRAQRRPPVWTVRDAAYAMTRGGNLGEPKDEGLWDTTPPYLRDRRLGHVYLIPAALESDNRPGYEAMANIPEEERNEAALKILKEMIERCNQSRAGVDCILIDSGAENNPLVSAGFVLATYGFIASSPNPQFRAEIPHLASMHRYRYPKEPVCAMNIVVNQATAETSSLWGEGQNVTFVPEDPTMRLTSTSGTFDFEGVGLNRFYLAVLRVLQRYFSVQDQQMLPEEGEVWVRPYLEAMGDFPETLLRKPRYRFLALVTTGFIVVAAITTSVATSLLVSAGKSPSTIMTRRTMSKPAEWSEAEFNARVKEIQIPPELVQKVALDGSVVKVKGTLAKGEIARLKVDVPHEFFKDAVVEAALLANNKAEDIARKKRGIRQSCVMLLLLGVGIGIFGLCKHFKFLKRRRLLHRIIHTRDSGRKDELSKFVRSLVQTDAGKPQLRWLRDEFRRFSSLPGIASK